MSDSWAGGPAAPRTPARDYVGPKRKMLEVSAPTHAAIVAIARDMTERLGRAVTMAEVAEKLVDFWETERR